MTIPTILTVEIVRSHLRMGEAVSGVAGVVEDGDLQLKLNAATQLVCEHIADRQPADTAWIATIEAWDETTAPAVVVSAILDQVGDLFRFRGDDVAGDVPSSSEYGCLTPFAMRLLARYRSPVLS